MLKDGQNMHSNFGKNTYRSEGNIHNETEKAHGVVGTYMNLRAMAKNLIKKEFGA